MTDTPRLQLPRTEELSSAPEEYQAFTIPSTFGEYVPMVELRLKTGERVGLPYPWLGEVRMSASVISLSFTTGVTVSIRGRNLSALFAALVKHQAVYVREADAPTAELAPESSVVVEAIEVNAPPRPGER
jgi:hypothetical protein